MFLTSATSVVLLLLTIFQEEEFFESNRLIEVAEVVEVETLENNLFRMI